MKKYVLMFIVILMSFSKAQVSRGKNFGFGIIAGDPTGLTLKYWNSGNTAFVFDLGASYFGSPRIGMDYIWHFNSFESKTVMLYAGPGAAIGIGEGRGFYYKRNGNGFYVREGNSAGLGVRGIIGLNIIPRSTPLEFFLEAGVLVGLSPDFGSAFDAALGMRFYP